MVVLWNASKMHTILTIGLVPHRLCVNNGNQSQTTAIHQSHTGTQLSLPCTIHHQCPLLYTVRSCFHMVNYLWNTQNRHLKASTGGLPRWHSSWGQHGAHLGPVGPRLAPCWPHEPCYQGRYELFAESFMFDLLSTLVIALLYSKLWWVGPHPNGNRL